jgi:hypothetical protein
MMACSRCAKRKAKLKAAVAKAAEALGLKPATGSARTIDMALTQYLYQKIDSMYTNEWPPAWLEWR